MRKVKLSLDVETLAVESFDTGSREAESRGTVRGNDWTAWCDTQYDRTCNGYGTCGIYPCKQVP